ncbi:MAG: DUF4124 domain-containing protein [Chromatiaceae bacterium]|nr:DUF4124 domain-containing protein [Candidatus Thioaporhodococcus sediminis]
MIAKSITAIIALLAAPAFGQTMYKCPNPAGVLTYQQTPCTPTGGGEPVPVKAIPTTGATLELNAQGHAYMASNAERWKAQAEADKRQEERDEDLRVELRKARAAEEQAAAQRATARAIWATGRRR